MNHMSQVNGSHAPVLLPPSSPPGEVAPSGGARASALAPFARMGSRADLPSGASHLLRSRSDLAPNQVLRERRPQLGLNRLDLRPTEKKGEPRLCKINWPKRWAPTVEGQARTLGARIFGRSHTTAEDNRRDIAAALGKLKGLESSDSVSADTQPKAEGHAPGAPAAKGPDADATREQETQWGAGREGVPDPTAGADHVDPASTGVQNPPTVTGAITETQEETDTLAAGGTTASTHTTDGTFALAATDDTDAAPKPGAGNSAEELDPTIALSIGFALSERLKGGSAGMHGPAAFEIFKTVVDMATTEKDTQVSLLNLRLLIGGLTSTWPYPVKEFVAHEWLKQRVGNNLQHKDIAVAQGLGLASGYEGLLGLDREAMRRSEEGNLPKSMSQFISYMAQARPLSRDWLDLTARCAPSLLGMKEEPDGIGPTLETYLKLIKHTMGAAHVHGIGENNTRDYVLSSLRRLGLPIPGEYKLKDEDEDDKNAIEGLAIRGQPSPAAARHLHALKHVQQQDGGAEGLPPSEPVNGAER